MMHSLSKSIQTELWGCRVSQRVSIQTSSALHEAARECVRRDASCVATFTAVERS